MSQLTTLAYAKLFFKGVRVFKKTGKTPFDSFIALRNLFIRTNGRLNDWCAAFFKITRGKLRNVEANGVLGKLSDNDVKQIANKIEQDGYYVFPEKLSDDIVNDIYNFCLNEPVSYLKVEENPKEWKIEFSAEKIKFDKEHPVSPKYEFEASQAFLNYNIQKLFFDQSFMAIANEYFGSRPILDLIALWWSAPFHRWGRSESAQLFHFDMDRIKFLKFFFYLTDVDAENGPHCYVKGSHKRLPDSLRREGRRDDEEVFANYKPSDIVEIVGKRGTIIAANTRGLHKGKELEKNCRLLFQIEFAVSMFGASYAPIDVKLIHPEFLPLLEKYPDVYKPIFGLNNSYK